MWRTDIFPLKQENKGLMMNNNTLKILYINGSFLNDSGSGVIAKNTYDIFKRQGFTVEFFTTKNYSFDNNYKFNKYFPEHFGTPIKYLLNQWRYYYNFTAQKNLDKLLNEFEPDIVHIHSLRISSLTYSIFKPILKRNIPIVMTLHDAYLICPMMTLIKGDGKICKQINCQGFNKFSCLFNNCANNIEQSFRYSLMSFINKLTRYDKYIKKIITPSEALRNIIVKYNSDINMENIITINNFLNFSELQVIPNYLNKKYFLYIGRLSKEKGVKYLLEAMKDLSRDIKIKIVGTGKEEQNLKRYAKENNLDNVEFVGFKSREEIKEYYQNCIATILPSNCFEIFGMTNIESFINGKPVIASNIGGIPEIVEHDITGQLFEPGNVEQLKECILKYWNNPELAVEHGKKGYEKVLTNYTEDIYFKKLIKLYEEILNDSQKHNN